MNMIFTTFLHGISLPLLFPITLFGIGNQYVSERLMFAYFYRKPPLFNNDMNRASIQILYYAPLFMLINGYWLLGNRQMFFNEVSPVEHATDHPDPGHRLFHWKEKIDCTLILFVAIPIFFWLPNIMRFA